MAQALHFLLWHLPLLSSPQGSLLWRVQPRWGQAFGFLTTQPGKLKQTVASHTWSVLLQGIFIFNTSEFLLGATALVSIHLAPSSVGPPNCQFSLLLATQLEVYTSLWPFLPRPTGSLSVFLYRNHSVFEGTLHSQALLQPFHQQVKLPSAPAEAGRHLIEMLIMQPHGRPGGQDQGISLSELSTLRFV